MRPCLHIAGPTAVGKSAVALDIALRCGGEILTADSMQVYRGLDIGTAKPAAERAIVPHHLLDLVGLDEGFDVQRWVEAAQEAVAGVRARGRLPIFCGGTGLYFRAWIEGLDALPAADPELRRELEARPLAELLAELQAGDPATWARIDRHNPRRVVRAVEILRGSGPRAAGGMDGGVACEQKTGRGPGRGEPLFVLRRSPAELRRRMDARVDVMFAEGLVEETRRLLEAGLGRNPVAMQAIGYRQVVEHLRGDRDLASTVALIKTRTWQFGRRQMTWFRHRPGVVWVDIEEGEAVSRTADRILAHPAWAGLEPV